MAVVRVGVKGSLYSDVDGPAQWVEIDGQRFGSDAGVLSVDHHADGKSFGTVTVQFLCTGYMTVDAEEPEQ